MDNLLSDAIKAKRDLTETEQRAVDYHDELLDEIECRLNKIKTARELKEKFLAMNPRKTVLDEEGLSCRPEHSQPGPSKDPRRKGVTAP